MDEGVIIALAVVLFWTIPVFPLVLILFWRSSYGWDGSRLSLLVRSIGFALFWPFFSMKGL